MNAISLPEHLRAIIAQSVAEGRVPDEMTFIEEAVMRYALDLADATAEDDDPEVLAAAEEGIADIEAGRFETFSGPDGMARFRESLSEQLQERIVRWRE